MAGAGITEFLALLSLLLGCDRTGAGIMKKIKFPIIIATIGPGISVILIVDSIFVFQNISKSYIMESLLREEEEDEKHGQ